MHNIGLACVRCHEVKPDEEMTELYGYPTCVDCAVKVAIHHIEGLRQDMNKWQDFYRGLTGKDYR